jgi:hypothetical protein
MAPRDPANISIGPGKLWIAAAGTTEPTDATTAPGASFADLGWTEEGNTFTYTRENEDVYVAEETDPVRNEVTGTTAMLTLALSEATSRNLLIALNQWTGPAMADPTSIEPPDLGADLRYMILLDTPEEARWIFRRAVNRSDLEIARKKAPDKAAIPVEFKLEKPAGLKIFKVIPSATDTV